jgi:hypothetical protein
MYMVARVMLSHTACSSSAAVDIACGDDVACRTCVLCVPDCVSYWPTWSFSTR